LFTLNTPTHSEYQKIEHNEANDPDEDGRPESHIRRNVTNRSKVFKQCRHIITYILTCNKPTLPP